MANRLVAMGLVTCLTFTGFVIVNANNLAARQTQALERCEDFPHRKLLPLKRVADCLHRDGFDGVLRETSTVTSNL